MSSNIRQLGVGYFESDLGFRAELVGEGFRNFLVGTDSMAEDEDGTGAGVLAAAGAGGDLPAHGAVQAGAGAELVGQCA